MKNANSPASQPTVRNDRRNNASLAAQHADLIADISSIMHHPRSLARPIPSWRPPTKTLPGTHGSPPLTIAISRHRVGPRVKARLQGYGETRTPAYVMSARITDPAGNLVSSAIAEEWVRAILPRRHDGSVHELSSQTAKTYIWIVDGKFTPLQSPAAMFEAASAA